jgi:hypothetical protein
MDVLNVDFEQIRRSGAGIGSSAQGAADRMGSFQSELAGYGEPWGNDMIGSLIGGCYQAISQAAFESFGENVKEMARHGQKAQAMAAGYQQSEDDSAVEVNRLRQMLG